MEYLGVELSKPKIGVFDFTSCEGCELQLANKEESLLDFLALVEVVNFREISSDKRDDFEIALIEGCVSREDEIERLKAIRRRARVVVALGSCACYGGVSAQKARFPLEDVVREVYGADSVDTAPVQRIGDVIAVDLEIPGCPVAKAEVERICLSLVTGTDVRSPKYSVCVECKHKLQHCVLDLGRICLGSVTRAGCGAVCPQSKMGCLGCRGPAEDANFASLREILRERGYGDFQIDERLGFFSSLNGARNGQD